MTPSEFFQLSLRCANQQINRKMECRCRIKNLANIHNKNHNLDRYPLIYLHRTRINHACIDITALLFLLLQKLKSYWDDKWIVDCARMKERFFLSLSTPWNILEYNEEHHKYENYLESYFRRRIAAGNKQLNVAHHHLKIASDRLFWNANSLIANFDSN